MENRISNVNFQGTYIMNFAKTGSKMKAGFEDVVGGKKCKILEDVDMKGRMFYILNNKKDYQVADFIKDNRLRFKYLPNVNNGFTFNSIKDIKKYISKKQPLIITKMDDLMNFMSQNRTRNYTTTEVQNKFYDKVLNKLVINVEGQKNIDSRGVVTIRDKKNDGLVKFSPQNKIGITYLYVKPSNKYEEIQRYAINKDGTVLYSVKTPEGIKKFKEDFIRAIECKTEK